MATLSGKTVLVIGGSSGIGHEIARQARAEGAELTITGRDAQRLALAAEDLGGLEAIQLDAHDETALNHFLTERPPVDHMVSMVGDSMAGGFLSTTPETMRHVLHSKFWTNWMVGRHAPSALVAGGSLTFTAGTGGRAQDGSRHLRRQPWARRPGRRARLRVGPRPASQRGRPHLHGGTNPLLERRPHR